MASFIRLLPLISAFSALPIPSHHYGRVYPRAVGSLDQAATAEAQQRDDTATRAFSGVPILTSSGNCLTVDPLGGDFRANLIPITEAECDGSPNQDWDILTSGKHNDRPGFALFVSSLTQGCLNFDDRRADGDKVILFSCGGRADGEGQVTDSQLFPFSASQTTLTLSPANSKNSTCLEIVNGRLDARPCDDACEQEFTLDGEPGAQNPEDGDGSEISSAPVLIQTSSSASAAPVETSSSSEPATTTSAPGGTIPTANPTTEVPVSRAGGTLQPSAAAEANQRDDTATRAATGVEIKTPNGKCLFVDPTAGDFRQNLIPVTEADCDGSLNTQWDLITSGKHNNQQGATLITQGCLNFDDRRADGDKVIIFSCGGRADGEGATTDSQLFPFTAGETSLALSPKNSQGKTCFVIDNGKLDAAACDGAADQTFTIGGGAGNTPAPVQTSSSSSAAPVETSSSSSSAAPLETSSSELAATTSVPAGAVPTANPTTEVPVSRAGGTLQPSAAAEANQRDDTATRAATGVQIKIPSGKCLFVDPTAGDFRQNLIPVTEADCDGSLNTQWDLITSGKHNNQQGATLIVSSITQGCLNFDDRRADGDKVIIFSCGGRADGEGETTDSQLFPFTAGETSLALSPKNSQGKTCFVINNGKLDAAACDGASDQTFTLA
ncbi:hypothetical protein BT69DRAFT_1302012 [Atractiella rhizophila]|nr:hypothetical protein BT69DRAFT_1302012 [Atractiella rhizophila]